MQYWPRKRSRRPYPRVRHWQEPEEAKPAGFAGYKAGMTHVLVTETIKGPVAREEEVSIPATVIECPPLKVFSARFYKKEGKSLVCIGEVTTPGLDKDMRRSLIMPKKGQSKKLEEFKDFDDVRAIVHTQPKATGIGKKAPDVFELPIGGGKDKKLAYIKENLGKEIRIDYVFKEGDSLDAHSVSKGKGVQGPVKRFGVKIRNHKSEKTKRGPGSLGGWKAQGHVMYRVAHAGQHGYHARTEHNKWIMKIAEKPAEINPKGGFVRYGNIKSQFILVKGSVCGPAKRLIIMSQAARPNKRLAGKTPNITYVSLDSKQR